MSLDRPDLSAAFTNKKAPVDRTAGLTGLLPAPRPRPSTSTTTPSTTTPSTTLGHAAQATPASPSVEPAPTVEPPAAKPVRPIRTTKTPPVSDSADITANVAVYLEPDLLELVKRQRRATETTYDELVRTAFAEIDEDQVRAAFTHEHTPADGNGMPVRKRRVRGTAGIQLQLRLDGFQRAWLDETQQRVGAPSRSALVARVLRLHLTD